MKKEMIKRENVKENHNNEKRGEQGSIVVFVLTSLLFMLIFVMVSYSNVVNKKTTTIENIETIKEEYGTPEKIEEEMKEEYEEVVLDDTSYLIKYQLNGGEVSGNPHRYTYQDTPFRLNNPTKEGYVFIGWTGTNGTVPNKNVTINPAEFKQQGIKDLMYVAIYEANTYQIIFDGNTGTGTMSNQTLKYDQIATIKKNEYKKTGYRFDRWNTKRDGTGTQYIDTQEIKNLVKEGTIKLYAQWKKEEYRLTINPNGGKYNNTTEKTIIKKEYESTINIEDAINENGYKISFNTNGGNPLDAITTPKKFIGWTNEGAGKLEGTTYTFGAGDGVLTAKYGNSTVILPTPVRNGYTFQGWTENGKKVETNYIATKNTELKAEWKVNEYAIRYNLNGGTVSGNPDKYTVEDTITIKAPTKTGYTFIGWTGSNGTTPNKNVTIEKGTTGEKIYEANYTANTYNVVFNNNGGTGSMTNQQFTYDKEQKIKANEFKKVGHVFVGWNTQANGTGTSYYNEQITKNISTEGTVTLYAQWSTGEFVLTINPNGGKYENSTVNKQVKQKYNTTIEIKNPTVPEGYVVTFNTNGGNPVNAINTTKRFTGWTNEGAGKLEGTTYTFGAGNGALIANYENNAITLPTPVKRGHKFLGWYDGKNKVNQTYVANRTVELEAHWEIISYTLKINPNGGKYNHQSQIVNITKPYNTTIDIMEPEKPEEYTVTFNTNGGDPVANITESRRFIGWEKTGAGILKDNKYTFEDGTGELTANYEKNNIILPNATRKGYTFKGWSKNNLSTNPEYKAGDSIRLDSNTLLFAIWGVNNYYFDLNWALDGQSVNSVEKVSAGLIIDGKDKGLVKDYYQQHPCGTKWEIYGLNIDGKNIKYHQEGKIGDSYTEAKVNLNTLSTTSNDSSIGTVSSTNMIVVNGTTYSTNGNILILDDGRQIIATVKDLRGYTTTFKNWSSTSGTINKKLNITANFEKVANKFTIIYDANGGTGTPNNQEAIFDQTFTVSKEVPTKTGYTFMGWYDTTNVAWTNWSGRWNYVEGEYGIKNNTLKLVARWKDTTKPIISVESNTSGERWTNQDVTVEIVGSDEGSGIDRYEWFNGKSWVVDGAMIPNKSKFTSVFTEDINGIQRFRAVDKAGNISEEVTTWVRIDKTLPTLSVKSNSSGGNWTNQNVTIILAGNDQGSGINRYEWWNGSSWVVDGAMIPNKSEFTSVFSANRNGIQRYRLVDEVGNISEEVTSWVRIERQAPELNLSKETYLEGFNGWEAGQGHTIDAESMLTMPVEGESTSPFYDVGGEPWYITFDGWTNKASAEHDSTHGDAGNGPGGILVLFSYFDNNFKATASNNTFTYNGQAPQLPLNTWSKGFKLDGYKGHGANVQYLKLNFATGGKYSQPTVKVKNLKVHGQLWSSFYDITIVTADNQSGIETIKYAPGIQNVNYFANNGTIVSNGTFRVTENGDYTVYVVDKAGNSTVNTINVNRIDKRAPNIKLATSGGMIKDDPTFEKGMNGIKYYNRGGDTVKVDRIAEKTPYGNYKLTVTTNGPAKPGLGGIRLRTNTSASETITTKLIAKIPKGYKIEWATDIIGTDYLGDSHWLTEREGTGKWEEYKFSVTTGATGEFGRTNYFYLEGPEASTTNPVQWDIGYVAEYSNKKIDDDNAITFRAEDFESKLASFGISRDRNTEPEYYRIKTSEKAGDILENIHENGIYYIWTKDLAGNKSVKEINVTNVGYKIIYDGNGGSNVPTEVTKMQGQNINISTNEVTKKYHTFLGWSEDKYATIPTYYKNDVFNKDKNTTLYAVWRKELESIEPGEKLEENKEYENNGIATIPKGFIIVPGCEDVSKGLVISDDVRDTEKDSNNKVALGNQFVWIPVENYNEFVREEGYYHLSKQNLLPSSGEADEKGINSNHSESIVTQNEAIEMYKSVKTNKGFYIGRYESGKDSELNTVIKKGADTYGHTTWQEAVDKSRNMYTDIHKYGVDSTLCYAVQWDAALRFLSREDPEYRKDNTKEGWYVNNYNRTDIEGNINTNPTGKTGEDLIYNKDTTSDIANMKKNVYDMPGNEWEWTMESYGNDRIIRGGSRDHGGSNSSSMRKVKAVTREYGFRTALFIDNKVIPGEIVLNSNKEYNNNGKAVIPKGFTVVPGLEDVSKGLVITDDIRDTEKDSNNKVALGNQFVWIPVTNMNDFRRVEGYKELALDNKLKNTGEASITDNKMKTESSRTQAEAKTMYKSVRANKGFYIGRYEAGLETPRKEPKEPLTKAVVKKNANPYNYIVWSNTNDYNNESGGAVELARELYNNKDIYGATSTLCYGVQWDAALNFIDSRYITNRNELDPNWLKSEIVNAVGKGNFNSTGAIKTGSNENYQIKNIYDMAGNLCEWTMEGGYLEKSGIYGRCFRGGDYDNTSEFHSYSYRNMINNLNGSTNGTAKFGFRVTLFINDKDYNNVEAFPGEIVANSNKEYNNNGKAIIPKGFAIVPGLDDVSKGLVISDDPNDTEIDRNNKISNGNQFVWIPVTDMSKFVRQEGFQENNLQNILNGCGEADARGVNNKVKESTETQQESQEMYKSVADNGGFYIGRYEAGVEEARTSYSTPLPDAIVKKNKPAYNYIGWSDTDDINNEKGGAVEIARRMYTDKNTYGVRSTLCYGVQWDAALNFIDNKYITNAAVDGKPTCTADSYIVNSSNKGNYSKGNYSETITGSDDAYALNNIYDMAGNLGEWTMESYNTNNRVNRGGYYNYSGSNFPSSNRSCGNPSLSYINGGFRVALYVQN